MSAGKGCGCSYGEIVGIEYCPLHSAAPFLLKAVKEAERLAMNQGNKVMRQYFTDVISKAEGR